MEVGLKNAAEALKNKNEIAVLTTGISMRPMLREHRDIVIVERVTRPLVANDVPLYSRPGSDKFVLHRILRVKPDGYEIRGDNLFQKEWVRPEQIIGVLKAFYRDGKYCDCASSRGYRVYIFANRVSYPFRRFWRLSLKPFLSRVKHSVVRS